MRKLLNKKGAVIGLAAASTVALTLGTVLPLTLNKSSSTSHNQQQKYQLISGLNPTTDYEVGTPISLELNPVSQVDYNNHNFEWYMGTSSGDPRLYQTTTAPKITLTNIGAAFDNAYIFCVLVPDAEINTLNNFYNTKSTSTPKSSNVVYYAQTQLKLDTPFAIESCEVVPTSESSNNKVIFSDDVALVPNNTELSLEVFVTTKGEDWM